MLGNPNRKVPISLCGADKCCISKLFQGFCHHLVWLHHHHAQLQAAGGHHLLLPELVCAGILHPASDGGHGGVSDCPDRGFGDSEFRCAAGGSDGVLRLVHLCFHGLPRRQPAAKPQSAGGVSGVSLLLCYRVDYSDFLAVPVTD